MIAIPKQRKRRLTRKHKELFLAMLPTITRTARGTPRRSRHPCPSTAGGSGSTKPASEPVTQGAACSYASPTAAAN